MREVTEGKNWSRAALVLGAAFVFLGANKAPEKKTQGPFSEAQRVIREAENLSLMQDRYLACSALYRAYKKSSGTDAQALKEKLLSLSRYFYTDKGFQDFLSAKELFEKGKYSDALEKISEADEQEKSNIDVLHLMTMIQLRLQNPTAAATANKKALQVCPIDPDLEKDRLAVEMGQEKWSDSLKTADSLIKDGEASAFTLASRGKILMELDMKIDAKRSLEAAQKKDPAFPETYFWLSQVQEGRESGKFLAKYVELCKRKAAGCAYLPEAEKQLDIEKSKK